MTKYKCDICGEKYDKERITIECPYCYFKGCEIELNKPRTTLDKILADGYIKTGLELRHF